MAVLNVLLKAHRSDELLAGIERALRGMRYAYISVEHAFSKEFRMETLIAAVYEYGRGAPSNPVDALLPGCQYVVHFSSGEDHLRAVVGRGLEELANNMHYETFRSLDAETLERMRMAERGVPMMAEVRELMYDLTSARIKNISAVVAGRLDTDMVYQHFKLTPTGQDISRTIAYMKPAPAELQAS